MTQQHPPTRAAMWKSALIFSICVTAASAVVAAVVWKLFDVSFPLTFVYLRWLVVLVLLITPVVHHLLLKRRSWQLPVAFQTPVTALLLTCESIGYDIISAHIRHG